MEKALAISVIILGMLFSAGLLLRATMPAIARTGSAVVSFWDHAGASNELGAEIAEVTSELDSQGTWRDADGDGSFDVVVWLKNTGRLPIHDVTPLDVVISQPGDTTWLPHESLGTGLPRWSATVEGGTSTWDPGETLRVNVHYASAVVRGRTLVSVGLHDGFRATRVVTF